MTSVGLWCLCAWKSSFVREVPKRPSGRRYLRRLSLLSTRRGPLRRNRKEALSAEPEKRPSATSLREGHSCRAREECLSAEPERRLTVSSPRGDPLSSLRGDSLCRA